MAPRPDVSEERKNQIVEAAMNVFTRLGLSKARMDDIADESGLSKGALYWYFKSKDDIIASILGSMVDREMGELKVFLQSEGSAAARLNQVVAILLKDMQRMKRWMPLLYEVYALILRNIYTRNTFKEYFRNYTSILTEIIQQGIEQGEIRPINATDFAIAMAATLEGSFLVYVYDPERVDFERNMQASFQFLLDGVLIKQA